MIRRIAILLALSMGQVWAQDAVPDLPLSKPLAPKAPAAAPLPPPPGDANSEEDMSLNWVILGGLDKLTARVVTIKTEVGRTARLGQLEIIPRACRQRRPEASSPESAAFLDIWDVVPGKPAQSAFRGWMFASSPALSAMEHPIYDVWVLSCAASGN